MTALAYLLPPLVAWLFLVRRSLLKKPPTNLVRGTLPIIKRYPRPLYILPKRRASTWRKL